MTKVVDFEPILISMLPETYTLLRYANLTIHPYISRIILHGSRGPAGGYRLGSDIDLSLIVDAPLQTSQPDIEPLLHSVFVTTYNAWQAAVEPDLAIIFDTRHCALRCFDQTAWDEYICAIGGVDCFGLYKVEKGFNGLVKNAGIQVKLMYPCLKIWQRT